MDYLQITQEKARDIKISGDRKLQQCQIFIPAHDFKKIHKRPMGKGVWNWGENRIAGMTESVGRRHVEGISGPFRSGYNYATACLVRGKPVESFLSPPGRRGFKTTAVRAKTGTQPCRAVVRGLRPCVAWL